MEEIGKIEIGKICCQEKILGKADRRSYVGYDQKSMMNRPDNHYQNQPHTPVERVNFILFPSRFILPTPLLSPETPSLPDSGSAANALLKKQIPIRNVPSIDSP